MDPFTDRKPALVATRRVEPLPCARESRFLAQLFVPEAMHEVVIDHSDGLHERIADGRADELEAASPQVLAQRVRFRRRSRDFLRRPPLVLYRPAADELPNVRVEAAEILLYVEE